MRKALAILFTALVGAPLSAAELSIRVTAEGEGLEGAVILVKGELAEDAPALAAGEAAIDQVDRQFVPALTLVRPETVIRFPNHDDIHHHVYSFSPAKQFELPLYKGVAAQPVSFDQSGIVTLGCNIHDWMLAHVVVTDAPVVRLSEAGGPTLLDLPPGAYEVAVWHPRVGVERWSSESVNLDERSRELGFELELEPELEQRRGERGRGY